MELIDITDTLYRVALAGRLDTSAVSALEMRFTATLSGTAKDAIVDLSDCEFCGSLAIRMFLSAARVMTRRGRRMVIAGPQPEVQEVFDTVALDTIVPVFPTVDEAQAHLTA